MTASYLFSPVQLAFGPPNALIHFFTDNFSSTMPIPENEPVNGSIRSGLQTPHKSPRISSWHEGSPQIHYSLNQISSPLTKSKHLQLSISTPELCKTLIKKRSGTSNQSFLNHHHKRFKHKIDQILETCENIFVSNIKGNSMNALSHVDHGNKKHAEVSQQFVCQQQQRQTSKKIKPQYNPNKDDVIILDENNSFKLHKLDEYTGSKDILLNGLPKLWDNNNPSAINHSRSESSDLSTTALKNVALNNGTLRKKKLLHRYRILPNLKSFTSNFNSSSEIDEQSSNATKTGKGNFEVDEVLRTGLDKDEYNNNQVTSAFRKSKKGNYTPTASKIFRVGSYRKKLNLNKGNAVPYPDDPTLAATTGSKSKFFPKGTEEDRARSAVITQIITADEPLLNYGLTEGPDKFPALQGPKGGQMLYEAPLVSMMTQSSNSSLSIKMNVLHEFREEEEEDEELEDVDSAYLNTGATNLDIQKPKNHVFYVLNDVLPFTMLCSLCGHYLTCKTFKCKYCHCLFHELCARNARDCSLVKNCCLSMSMIDSLGPIEPLKKDDLPIDPTFKMPRLSDIKLEVSEDMRRNSNGIIRGGESLNLKISPETSNLDSHLQSNCLKNTYYQSEFLNQSFDESKIYLAPPSNSNLKSETIPMANKSHVGGNTPLLQKLKLFGSSDDIAAFSNTSINRQYSLVGNPPNLRGTRINLENNGFPKDLIDPSNKCRTIHHQDYGKHSKNDISPDALGNEALDPSEANMESIESKVHKFIDSAPIDRLSLKDGSTIREYLNASLSKEIPDGPKNCKHPIPQESDSTTVRALTKPNSISIKDPNCAQLISPTSPNTDIWDQKCISKFLGVASDPFLNYDIMSSQSGSPDEMWTKIRGDKNLTKHMNSKDVKRQDVIHELIQTEKLHLQTLSIIIKIYSFALKNCFRVPEFSINSIFPRVDALYDIHHEFYQSLRKRQSENAIIENIGDVLLDQFTGEMADRMKKEYGLFCSEHKSSISTFKSLIKTDKNVQTFMQEAISHQLCRRKSVPECILAITQRITKYPIFLESIIKANKGKKHKSNQPEDDEMVVKALIGLKSILTFVDEQIAHKEMQEKLLDIVGKIETKSFTTYEGTKFTKIDLLVANCSNTMQALALTPDDDVNIQLTNPQNSLDGKSSQSSQMIGVNRFLIHEGGRLEVCHAGLGGITKGKHSSSQIHMLLFNDILVFLNDSTTGGGSGNNKYTFLNNSENVQMSSVLNLKKLIFREKAGEPNVFYIINCQACCPEMYEVTCENVKIKTCWMIKLRKALAQASIFPDLARAQEIKRNSSQIDEDFKKMQENLDKVKKWIGDAEFMDRDMDVILTHKHVALNNVIGVLESEILAATLLEETTQITGKNILSPVVVPNSSSLEFTHQVTTANSNKLQSVPSPVASSSNLTVKSTSSLLISHRKSISQEAGLINAFFDKFKKEVDQSSGNTGLFKHMNFGGSLSPHTTLSTSSLKQIQPNVPQPESCAVKESPALTDSQYFSSSTTNKSTYQLTDKFNDNLTRMRDFLRKFIDQVKIQIPSPSSINLNRSVSDVLDIIKPSYDLNLAFYINHRAGKMDFISSLCSGNDQHPKRAETFSGFDAKANFTNDVEQSLGGFNKLRLNTLNEQNERDIGQVASAENQKSNYSETITGQSTQAVFSSSSTSSLNSPLGSSLSSKNSLVSSPVSSISITSQNGYRSQKDLVSAVGIPNSILSYHNEISRLKFLQILEIFLNFVNHEITNQTKIKTDTQELRFKISKFENEKSDRKSYVWHNQQLEELRNLQENVTKDKESFKKDSETKKAALEAEKCVIKQQLEELKLKQERLKADQELIEAQKMTIQRYWADIVNHRRTGTNFHPNVHQSKDTSVTDHVTADVLNLTIPDHYRHLNSSNNTSAKSSFLALPSSHYFHSRSKSYEDNPFLISANAFSSTAHYAPNNNNNNSSGMNPQTTVLRGPNEKCLNESLIRTTKYGENPLLKPSPSQHHFHGSSYYNHNNNNHHHHAFDNNKTCLNALPSHLISSTNEKKLKVHTKSSSHLPANLASGNNLANHYQDADSNFQVSRGSKPYYPNTAAQVKSGFISSELPQTHTFCTSTTTSSLPGPNNSFSFSFKRYQDWKEHYDNSTNLTLSTNSNKGQYNDVSPIYKDRNVAPEIFTKVTVYNSCPTPSEQPENNRECLHNSSLKHSALQSRAHQPTAKKSNLSVREDYLLANTTGEYVLPSSTLSSTPKSHHYNNPQFNRGYSHSNILLASSDFRKTGNSVNVPYDGYNGSVKIATNTNAISPNKPATNPGNQISCFPTNLTPGIVKSESLERLTDNVTNVENKLIQSIYYF